MRDVFQTSIFFERSVPSVVRNRNVEMPRAGESQLSLSVRQEGSGAMRMWLRAAYSLTHEPKSPSIVSANTDKGYEDIQMMDQPKMLKTCRYIHSHSTTSSKNTSPMISISHEWICDPLARSGFVHCGLLSSLGFGTNPSHP